MTTRSKTREAAAAAPMDNAVRSFASLVSGLTPGRAIQGGCSLRWVMVGVLIVLGNLGSPMRSWGQGNTVSSQGRVALTGAAEALTETDAETATPTSTDAWDMARFLGGGPQVWTSPQGLSSALQVMLMLTVLSLAPSILLMTTCFIRVLVVLGLLRQALGTQQLPPSQVLTSIALFVTLLVMAPVWQQVYDNAIEPYTSQSTPMSLEEVWTAGITPIREFMSRQIELAGNSDDVWLFYEYLQEKGPEPTDYADVPLRALLPAFMLSELKVAFLIGFQIYLPFLILDIVVSTITISMGMMMLPPVLISLPFKLMLFVLVDGWHLVIGMLMESFGTLM